jgi:hypothetical protein
MVVIAGTDIPLLLLLPVAIGFPTLIGIIIFMAFRRPAQKETVQEDRMAIVIPVDENENMGVGKLLSGVQRSETKIIVTDPDVIGNDGQPKEFSVDVSKKLPVKVIDSAKNIIELWGVFDRGEWEPFSFADLLKNVKKRWDPLEADPQDIGDFYVGWGYLRKGFGQVLSTTSGKILVFGALLLIGFLLGMFTVTAHVGHI